MLPLGLACDVLML